MTKSLMHLIAAAGFLLLTLIAYGAWFTIVGRTSAEASALRTEIANRGEAGTRAAMARKTLDDLALQEASLYGHLVAPSDIVSFLETVEGTGRRLGTSIEVVSVGPAQNKQNQIALALSISGPFDAVMRTLGALEYQKYATTLTNLTLESQGASAGIWEAAVTFTVAATPQSAQTTTP